MSTLYEKKLEEIGLKLDSRHRAQLRHAGGTDPFHTRPALLDTATAVCRDLGWTTANDRPFSGALVPMSFYRRDARVQSLMIEVNRRLYMDETTGARSAGFDTCRTRIGRLISAIVSMHGAR